MVIVVRTEDLVHSLKRTFGISFDVAASDDDFPDWRLIAESLVDIVSARQCRVIGICGSQGSGKSTLAEICVSALRTAGCNAAACSIDDFYLTKVEREVLANTVHPLLRTRGVPGTHDTQWLARVLNGAKQGHAQPVPMFNKGLDDRRGERVIGADVLILEGWCVGVQPEPDSRLIAPCNLLEEHEDEDGTWRNWVNEQIAPGYLPLWSMIDFWLQLKPPSFEQVFEWRTQQEKQIQQTRRMNDVSVRRFIEHYERLTRWQWACSPPAPGLSILLAADHTAERVDAHE